MTRKRKSPGLFAFVVFTILVLASGLVLKASGSIDSPFDEIAFLSQWANGGERQFEQSFGQTGVPLTLSQTDASTDTAGVNLTSLSTSSSTFQLPDLSTPTDVSGATDPGTDGSSALTDIPDRKDGIRLSDLGEVLYNLWFIGATTAVFIVVQKLYRISIKQFKQRLPRVAVSTE